MKKFFCFRCGVYLPMPAMDLRQAMQHLVDMHANRVPIFLEKLRTAAGKDMVPTVQFDAMLRDALRDHNKDGPYE